MKKVLIICPYFGKLPDNQMKLWLKSCSFNKKIDFVVITDDKTKYELPKNVKIIYQSFSEFHKKVSEKFNFKISLEAPYKICDYRPCFGYIFSDLIKGYDYWGHNDFTDSFFGNLDGILEKKLKDSPDKVGYLGHLTLYKNDNKINTLFMKNSKFNIKIEEILSSKYNKIFDESFLHYSINYIFREYNIPITKIDEYIFDIGTKRKSFMLYERGPNGEYIPLKKYGIIEWYNGKLYLDYIDKDNSIIKQELIYVHYQKRQINFNIDLSSCNHFILVPDMIIPCDKVDINLIKKYTSKHYIRFSYIKSTFKFYKELLKRRLKEGK